MERKKGVGGGGMGGWWPWLVSLEGLSAPWAEVPPEELGSKNRGRRRSIFYIPQKPWEAVPCLCQWCSTAEAGDLCGKAAEWTAGSLPHCPLCLLKAEKAAPPEMLLTQVLVIHFMWVSYSARGKRSWGAGCVRETHRYGNHILPVSYLRNVLVQGWEHSDSVQTVAAAVEGTCHRLHPSPQPPSQPLHQAALPPVSLCHQRQRHLWEVTAGWAYINPLAPRLWRSLPEAYCCALGAMAWQENFLPQEKWRFPVVTCKKVCGRVSTVLHRAQPVPELVEQAEEMGMLVAHD